MSARQLRLVRGPAPKARKPSAWPASLGQPVDPLLNTIAARAHSILHSLDVRDPRGLSMAEALTVIAWHEQFARLPYERKRELAISRRAIRIVLCCAASVALVLTLATYVAH